MKIFCPQCGEAYHASSNYRRKLIIILLSLSLIISLHCYIDIDGAYFSTTFPHLFFMTYEDLVPGMQLPTGLEKYAPRIFGFKVYSGKDKEIKDNASTKDSSKESSVGKGKTKGDSHHKLPTIFQSSYCCDHTLTSLIICDCLLRIFIIALTKIFSRRSRGHRWSIESTIDRFSSYKHCFADKIC